MANPDKTSKSSGDLRKPMLLFGGIIAVSSGLGAAIWETMRTHDEVAVAVAASANADAVPRTSTSLDRVTKGVLDKVGRLEGYEGAINSPDWMSCGPRERKDSSVGEKVEDPLSKGLLMRPYGADLSGQPVVKNASMVCSDEKRGEAVLEAGAWDEAKDGKAPGRMGWRIQVGEAGDAQGATLRVARDGFGIETFGIGLGSDVAASCDKTGKAFECHVKIDGELSNVRLEEAPGRILLDYLKELIKSRLINLREAVALRVKS